MSKIKILMLALSFGAVTVQAMPFARLLACWRGITSAAETGPQIRVTESDCDEAGYSAFTPQFRYADALDTGPRPFLITYSIVYLDGEGTTLKTSEPTLLAWDRWGMADRHFSSDIYGDIKRLGEGGVSQAGVARIEILVALSTRLESLAKTKPMVAGLIKRLESLQLPTRVVVRVAENKGWRPSSFGGWRARLSPLSLTPPGRRARVTPHLRNDRFAPEALHVDSDGKLLSPFPLPDGMRAGTYPSARTQISGLAMIPTEIDGSPVYAVRDDDGVFFGFEWIRTGFTVTSYELDVEG